MTLAAILLAADGMPNSLSFVGSISLFLNATMYLVQRGFAILFGRSPWITNEKKEAKILGLMKVVLFFILDRLRETASLMKMSSESNSLPVALAL